MGLKVGRSLVALCFFFHVASTPGATQPLFGICGERRIEGARSTLRQQQGTNTYYEEQLIPLKLKDK